MTILMSRFLEQQRDALARHLRRHIAGEVRFDAPSRKLYATDASIYQIEPLGVVLPRTADDLAAAVQIAAEMRVPITARGGGTSLSGPVDRPRRRHRLQQVPQPRSSTSTRRPHRPRPAGRRARPRSTAAWPTHGLQFGPDVATASRANLGGMIGNNSAGSRSIVYGKTVDHVRRLDVVLSDGTRADVRPADAGRVGAQGRAADRSRAASTATCAQRRRGATRDEIAPALPAASCAA